MRFERGFKAKANRIALKVRSSLGLSEIERFEPEEACRHFDIDLIRMTDLGCDCSIFEGNDSSRFSAVTVLCGRRIAIVHNDCHHVYRQRSNICHELAHLFLGHKAYPPLSSDGERFHDKGVEAEADFLGGALLMTQAAALHVLENRLRSRAQEIYGVSKPMLDWRIGDSGAQAIFARRNGKR